MTHEYLRVVSWNVLHRTHGEKWSKHVVRNFPDERERMHRIAKRVAAWLAEPGTAVCLQEVSGDQLSALRALNAQCFAHRYHRVPRSWRFWARQLADPCENLVTLVNAGTVNASFGQTFDSDDGKGLLAVDLDGARLVNTHLTFGKAGARQLAELAAVARGRAVVVGDFNAGGDVVAQALGKPFAIGDLGDGTTRAAGGSAKRGHSVDHIAVAGGSLVRGERLDGEGLSDHHPVSATLRFD
jgi:endonuclease/exonuclease/phosphatase family metal-dependent hydrolase